MKDFSDYYIERLTNSNFDKFVELHNLVFKKNESIETLQKKYDTSFIIEKYWVCMAFEKSTRKVVASYGVVPWLFNENEKKYLAAQSGDTMTVSNHRGKGLFGFLHAEVAALLKKQGFKFIFGFPNQKSYPVFKNKLNWKFYGNLNLYPLENKKSIPFKKLFWKFPRINDLHNKFVNIVFAKYETLDFNKLAVTSNILNTNKSDLYYRYKLNTQHKFIKVNQNYYLIKITNRLIIGDVYLVNDEGFEKDVSIIQKLAAKCGISEVDFICSKNSSLNSAFSSIKIPVDSYPVGIFELNTSQIDYNKIVFTFSDFDTF